MIEKPAAKGWTAPDKAKALTSQPIPIAAISTNEEARLHCPDQELNRVLGGGLVPGCVTLLGGEPGIGKSTLLLQISLQMPLKILYVSGEESQRQIKLRADRINAKNDHCYVLSETQTQKIFQQIIYQCRCMSLCHHHCYLGERSHCCSCIVPQSQMWSQGPLPHHSEGLVSFHSLPLQCTTKIFE